MGRDRAGFCTQTMHSKSIASLKLFPLDLLFFCCVLLTEFAPAKRASSWLSDKQHPFASAITAAQAFSLPECLRVPSLRTFCVFPSNFYPFTTRYLHLLHLAALLMNSSTHQCLSTFSHTNINRWTTLLIF